MRSSPGAQKHWNANAFLRSGHGMQAERIRTRRSVSEVKELRQAECGLARSFKRSILIAAIAVTFLGLEVDLLVFDVG